MSTTTITGAMTVAPTDLNAALKAVKPAVGTRSAVAALKGVRITADERSSFMYATDFEHGVRRTLPATVSAPLDVLVSHADMEKAANAVAKAPDVELCADGDELVVKGGSRTIRLRTLRMEDFPALPGELGPFTGDGEVAITADAATMARLIARAHPFASKDETRPILCGIHFDTDDSKVCVTDSYRLALLELDALMQPGHKLTIPASGLKLAARAMKTGMVTVSKFAQWAVIDNRAAGERWTIRLIEGQYPNWRQLIPDAWDFDVEIPTEQLRSACELAVKFAKRNAPMRMAINGQVTVSGHTPDECSFEEVLSDTTVRAPSKHDEFEIGFNPEFMRDVAKTVESDTALLRLVSPLRPGLVVDGADQFLLMPIRLNV